MNQSSDSSHTPERATQGAEAKRRFDEMLQQRETDNDQWAKRQIENNPRPR